MKFKLGDDVVIDIPSEPKLYGKIVRVPPEGTMVLDNETNLDNPTSVEPFNYVNCECFKNSDITVWFKPDNEIQYFVKMKDNQINMVFEQFLKPTIKKTLPKIDVASAAGGSKKEGADRVAGQNYDIILQDSDFYSDDNTKNPNNLRPSHDNSGSDENQSGGKKTRKKQLKKRHTRKTRQKQTIKRDKRKTRQKQTIKRHKRKTRQKQT
jgi:hypothetical protein